MPIVQATDIPYGGFPTGRTSPQAPSDYQQIPTDTSEFGALQGQALEKLGAGGEKLATGIGQIAVYRQHVFDSAETDKLSMALDDKIEKLKRGDRNAGIDPNTGRKIAPGFLDLVGSEAVNAGVPDLNPDIKELADQAPNDTVRYRFMHIARARRAEAMAAMDTHYEKQLDIHFTQVQQAAYDQGTRKAGDNWNDDGALNQALDDMGTAAVKASTDRDPAVLENLRLKAHAKGAENAVMSATAAGDEDRARHLYDTFQHLFPGDVKERLTERIEGVGQRRQAADDKRTGGDLERALNGEGPMPRAPGARGGGGQFRAPPGAVIAGANPGEQRVLNEIRHRENSGNYGVTDKADDNGGGAYQFLDSTWKEATAKAGIGTEYARGGDAPKDVQDAVALAHYRDKGIAPWNKSGPYPTTGGAAGGPQVQDFQTRLNNLVTDAAAKGIVLKPGQASRTREEQQQLYDADVAAHGGKPSGMVAKPGSSQHEIGLANDLHDAQGRKIVAGSAEDRWLQANAEDYGLVRPVKGEAWHVEPMGGRTQTATQPVRNPQTGKIEQRPRPAGTQVAEGPAVTSTDATPGGPALAAAPEPGAEPDWVDLGRRIRESNVSQGAKDEAFTRLAKRKEQFDFGKTPEKKQAYHHQVAAAVEQRTDEIVQSAVRSDDPAVHAKAQEDLATLHKWGVATGGLPADTAYKMERKANAELVTGRAAYLDAAGDPVAALAFVQQNKDKLPADALHTAVRALQDRADKKQGELLERGLMIGGGPGYVPGPAGPLPGGAPDVPTPLTPSPLRQKLDAIANSDYPDTVKKAASDAALARHHLETVGQDAAKSDLEMAISKGEASHAEVEAAARQGLISPAARTEMHDQLNKQDQVKFKQADALQRVNNAGNGGAPLDPKSAKGDPTAGRMSDRDALNFHYGQLAATWPPDEVYSRSIAYAEKYGLIPDALKSNLRGNLHSGSPGAQIGAANTIAELRNRNPQLVGELGDENDLRYATMLRTYTEAGVPPAQAVELATNAMKVAKPERDARDQAFNEERGKDQTAQHASDVKWIEGQNNGWFQADPTVDPVMRKEFEEVSKAEYVRTGNLEASRRMALDKINNIWGRTQVGGDLRYVKQAPEKYYGVPGLSDGENAAWMNEQLAKDYGSTAVLEDTPLPGRLHVIPSPDRTNPDGSGRPTYQVWLEHPETKDWNLQPGVWSPDWNSSSEKQRRDTQYNAKIEQLHLDRLGIGTGQFGRAPPPTIERPPISPGQFGRAPPIYNQMQ